jgi:hypothetical protein
VSDSQATRFHEATRICVSATLTLLELYVAQAIGGREFASIAGAFLEADERHLAADTIGARFAAYQRVAPFLVRT